MRGLLLVLAILFVAIHMVRWWLRRDVARPSAGPWGEDGPPRTSPRPPAPLPLPVTRDRLALAVEGSRTMLKVLEMVLGPEGFEVQAAETSDEVDRALDGTRPDVILLDPDLLGVEARGRLARRLQQDGRLQGVPVVLIGETGESLWPLEPVDRLPRPFESQDLVRVASSAALVGRANAPRDDRPAQAAPAAVAAPTCPVCADRVEGPVALCPRCGAPHHPECWKLNDGCGACGSHRALP